MALVEADQALGLLMRLGQKTTKPCILCNDSRAKPRETVNCILTA